MNVIDLGSAPGSWSQYAINQVGSKGSVIACDILFMKKINNVKFIQGNLNCLKVLNQLFLYCKSININVVLSDMSPNVSGCRLIDLPKMIVLNELAITISRRVLSKNGSLLFKLFQGEGVDLFLKKVCATFLTVKVCKPDSSRSRSREIFILAIGLKN